MKSLLISFIALASLSAQGAPKTFTGVISDSMCGADHSHMGVSPDAKCVRDCIRSGQGKYKYVLLVGSRSYLLSDQQTPEKFAAQRVKVTGTLFDKTGILQVEKIETAK